MGINLRSGAHTIARDIIPQIMRHRLPIISLVILGILIGGGEALVA